MITHLKTHEAMMRTLSAALPYIKEEYLLLLVSDALLTGTFKDPRLDVVELTFMHHKNTINPQPMDYYVGWYMYSLSGMFSGNIIHPQRILTKCVVPWAKFIRKYVYHVNYHEKSFN